MTWAGVTEAVSPTFQEDLREDDSSYDSDSERVPFSEASSSSIEKVMQVPVSKGIPTLSSIRTRHAPN